MTHHTKQKGDLATIKAMSDLTSKEYTILAPVVSEHLPFDFIAYKNNTCYRVQSKYSSRGVMSGETSWTDKNGHHKKTYSENDFDYYAIYLPSIDRVVYPSIEYAGCTIACQVPNSATPFYWYEDFLEFTSDAQKKTYRDFSKELDHDGILKEGEKQPWHIKMTIGKDDMEKLCSNMTIQQIADELKVYHETVRLWLIKNNLKATFAPASNGGGWNKGMEFPLTHKVKHPSKEELDKLLWEKPTVEIAKLYGVSDKAIEKWAKSYGLKKPARGYWAKLKSKSVAQ